LIQIFIIGFGRFGKKALSTVSRLWDKSRIWIIDHGPTALDPDRLLPGIRVLDDGPQFLYKHQKWIKDKDWIIPALPIHLAWKWLDLNLGNCLRQRSIIPPPNLGVGLPYHRLAENGLFLSQASFICPDDCPAPLGFCYKTKKRRTSLLWKSLIDQGCPEGRLAVIESRQIAPGVGGYRFEELKKILPLVQQAPPPFFIATACRCHGVVHGFTW
jgi:hypothetical protein